MWSFPKDELKIIEGYKESIKIDAPKPEPEDNRIYYVSFCGASIDRCRLWNPTVIFIGRGSCKDCSNFLGGSIKDQWVDCAKKKEAWGE